MTFAGPGLLAGFLLSGSPGEASAASSLSFSVNTTADAHNAQPGNGQCADSTGQCTLRAAIEASDAAATGSVTTITVPAGTYILSLGTLPVTANAVVVTGAGPGATVIEGPRPAAHRQLINVAAASTATFSQLTLTKGTASKASGGALTNSGTTTLDTVTVTSNRSASGRGLTNSAGAALHLVDTTVSGNMAATGGNSRQGGSGGGILNAGALSLNGSTVSGNYAGPGGAYQRPCGGTAPSGAGSALAAGGGRATVLYSTIAGNTDGIVAAGGAVTLGGTIVAGSTTGPNCTGTINETSGYNLDSGTSCGFSLPSDITGTEPSLGPLGSNGGPTQTQALQPGSPAVDHGGTSAVGCPATDQRGQVRPDELGDGGACDIGAYESPGVS